MKCPDCNCENIEIDISRGDAICTNCGIVLQENTIVNEVGFEDSAGGESQVVGTFISHTGIRGLSVSARSSVNQGNRTITDTAESREARIQKGRKRIQQLVSALNLSHHHAESALRLYRLAVQHNFVTGRRTINVIAVCLYTICRREQTPHLLLDFSDLLQTNVYILGGIYLKLLRVLNLSQPLVDPALFIPRYSAQLEFGNKTHLVTMTAIRLVQRMKKDWLQYGRRPHGLSGACLLIAARMLGFRRTQIQVANIVRIGSHTLSKRLYEFMETPSAALTVDEFKELDVEEECDPPAYKKLRKEEKEEQDILASQTAKVFDINQVMKEMQSSEFLNISESVPENENDNDNDKSNNSIFASLTKGPTNNTSLTALLSTIPSNALNSANALTLLNSIPPNADALNVTLPVLPTPASVVARLSTLASINNSTTKTFSKPSKPIRQKRAKKVYTRVELEKETLSDLSDDDEVSSALLNEEEQVFKDKVWTTVNSEYLQIQEEKAALSLVQPESVSKNKRSYKKRKTDSHESAADALLHTVKDKKVSSKINYAAFEELLNYNDSTETPVVTTAPRTDARTSYLSNKNIQSISGSNKYPKTTPNETGGRMVYKNGRMTIVYDNAPNPDPRTTIAADQAVLTESAQIVAEEEEEPLDAEIEHEEEEDDELSMFKKQHRLGADDDYEDEFNEVD